MSNWDFRGNDYLRKLLPWLRLGLMIILVAGIGVVLSCLKDPEGPAGEATDEGRVLAFPSIKGELSERALMKPGYLHNRILGAIDQIRPLQSRRRIPASDLAGIFAKAVNRVFQEEGESVRLEPEGALQFFEFFHRLAHEGAYDILHSDLSAPSSFAEFARRKGYLTRAQADSLAILLEELKHSVTDSLKAIAPGKGTSLLQWARFAAHDIYSASSEFWNNYAAARTSGGKFSKPMMTISDSKKVILADAAGGLLGLLGGSATAILGGAFASYVMQDYLDDG
jgi:hypothetical protein